MASENKSKSSNGGNIDKKRKHRFLPQNKPVKKGSYPLRPGVEGFFITCDVGRERQASHEALNVIDSFYEELVLGRASGVRHGQLPDKPLNKKTKFTYSDSSSSDDDDDSNGDYANDDQKDKEEDKDKPGTHKDGDANNESSIDANSDPHKQEEDKVENKEHATCHGSQVVEGEEPPAKKQCLKTDASKCGNFISNKMEEKSVDKLIEEELAELGDRSKFQQCWIFFLFFIFFYLETYARDRSLFPIQKKYMRRFSNLDSGCNGVVFVQMRKRDGDPGTKDIVQHMMTSVALTRKHTSRFMLRVLPVEVTCYASEEEITKAIKPLISQYFPVETQTAHKFAVLYEARANTGIDRMKIINAVAKSVPAPHKVDLNNPDKNIVVQIVKTVCLMGVVEKYKELSKYNLRQLTSSKP